MNSKPLLETSAVDESFQRLPEAFAFRNRVDELKSLQDGWFDGHGISLDQNGLDWLFETFTQMSGSGLTHNKTDLPLPFLFPTQEGNLLAEWPFKPWSPSLEINLKTKQARWHALNVEMDEERAKDLDLTIPDHWTWLAEQLHDLRGVAA